MKVAVAIWNDRISPVFDVSRRVLVLDIENGRVRDRCEYQFANDNPMHKIHMLKEMEIGTLICGAVSRHLFQMVNTSGVITIPFIAGNVDEVIDAFLAGALPNPRLSMPGCDTRKRQARGGRKKARPHWPIQNERSCAMQKSRGGKQKGRRSGKGQGGCGAQNSGGRKKQGGGNRNGKNRRQILDESSTQ